MTPEEIEQAERLCAEATPGEWRAGSVEKYHVFAPRPGQQTAERVILRMNEHFHYEANAAFIAHARTLLPKALAEIKRLQQRPDVERYGRLLVELEQTSAVAEHAKKSLAAARKEIRRLSAQLELEIGALEQACNAWPNAIDKDTAKLRAEVEQLRAQNKSLKTELARLVLATDTEGGAK